LTQHLKTFFQKSLSHIVSAMLLRLFQKNVFICSATRLLATLEYEIFRLTLLAREQYGLKKCLPICRLAIEIYSLCTWVIAFSIIHLVFGVN